MLRPIPKPVSQLPKLAPLGARWNVAFDLHRLLTNVLVTYQSQLDALHGDQVNHTCHLSASNLFLCIR